MAEIDQMALTYRAKAFTMGFCLDCHRDPAPNLRPADRITDMGWKPSGDRGRKAMRSPRMKAFARANSFTVTCATDEALGIATI